MQRRDYYVVLGIRPSEPAAGVRAAFRDLARRYHPDRAGPAAARFFQELVEAYYVLSDPERRASYDRGLEHAVPSHGGPSSVTTPPSRGRTAAEPLAPEPLVPEPVRILHDFHVTQTTYEEVFERFFRNFASPSPRSPRLMQPLRLQVIIGRD